MPIPSILNKSLALAKICSTSMSHVRTTIANLVSAAESRKSVMEDWSWSSVLVSMCACMCVLYVLLYYDHPVTLTKEMPLLLPLL